MSFMLDLMRDTMYMKSSITDIFCPSILNGWLIQAFLVFIMLITGPIAIELDAFVINTKVGTWSYLVGPVHLNGLLMVIVILVMVNSGLVNSGHGQF